MRKTRMQTRRAALLTWDDIRILKEESRMVR